MNKILKTIEYKDITLNVESNIQAFLNDIKPLFMNSSNKHLIDKWNSWYEAYRNDQVTPYLRYKDLTIWAGKHFKENRIVLNFDKQYINSVYINYINNGTPERINLQDLILLNKLNREINRAAGFYKQTLGSYDNVTDIILTTPITYTRETVIQISYEQETNIN